MNIRKAISFGAFLAGLALVIWVSTSLWPVFALGALWLSFEWVIDSQSLVARYPMLFGYASLSVRTNLAPQIVPQRPAAAAHLSDMDINTRKELFEGWAKSEHNCRRFEEIFQHAGQDLLGDRTWLIALVNTVCLDDTRIWKVSSIVQYASDQLKDSAEFWQSMVNIILSIYPQNNLRTVSRLGFLEYVSERLMCTNADLSTEGDIQEARLVWGPACAYCGLVIEHVGPELKQEMMEPAANALFQCEPDQLESRARTFYNVMRHPGSEPREVFRDFALVERLVVKNPFMLEWIDNIFHDCFDEGSPRHPAFLYVAQNYPGILMGDGFIEQLAQVDRVEMMEKLVGFCGVYFHAFKIFQKLDREIITEQQIKDLLLLASKTGGWSLSSRYVWCRWDGDRLLNFLKIMEAQYPDFYKKYTQGCWIEACVVHVERGREITSRSSPLFSDYFDSFPFPWGQGIRNLTINFKNIKDLFEGALGQGRVSSICPLPYSAPVKKSEEALQDIVDIMIRILAECRTCLEAIIRGKGKCIVSGHEGEYHADGAIADRVGEFLTWRDIIALDGACTLKGEAAEAAKRKIIKKLRQWLAEQRLKCKGALLDPKKRLPIVILDPNGVACGSDGLQTVPCASSWRAVEGCGLGGGGQAVGKTSHQ